jgi:predicted alpha-1,6-mannanase (GH76 family)
MIVGGINPGPFKTHSDVLVFRDVMYFRGTDDKVWQVPLTGEGATNPGGFKTQSNVVLGDDAYMYFRGTDDKVWRVSTTNPSGDNSNPGGFKTQSDVLLGTDGYMYFRGTDDKVWRVSPTNPSGDNTNPGGFKTHSNVILGHDGYMYFRGTDDKVWRVSPANPSRDNSNPGGFKTHSDVVLWHDGYMYFRGTDDKVWRVSSTNPSGNNSNPGGFKTQSDVLLGTDGYMYFRGTDDKVWRVSPTNPSGDNSNPGGFKTQSDVFSYKNSMYFRGTDDIVWRFSFDDEPLLAYTYAAVEQSQGWYQWDSGLWQGDHKPNNWWHSANALNALIDFMTIANDKAWLNVVTTTFNANKSGNFINQYYDDEGWWAMTWINAYDLTNDSQYLQMAETIFSDMTGGWDNTCGGGIWWHKPNDYKNAIANELFMAVAVRLFLRTQNPTYSQRAMQEASWFNKSTMINAQNLINDGLNANCKNNNGTTWTYNQGVILGALCDIHQMTSDAQFLQEAERIANAVLSSNLVNAQGIMRESCEPNCGEDGCQFKGIFIRNLAYLWQRTRTAAYASFIAKNAASAVSNRKDLANHYGQSWSSTADNKGPDFVRQSSAIDCLNAALRVGVTTI